MTVKIRLKRQGRKKKPSYSIVVSDSRTPRDGKYIEKIGTYSPLLEKSDQKYFTINTIKFKYWISNGAQPTKVVSRLATNYNIIN